MLEHFASWLVDFVHALGYAGVFIMTFLESTFVPLPSEVTMIPVGYLIQQGKMEFIPAFGLSILGTLLGSLANYAIARYFGRRFLKAYGKYMLLGPEKVDKLDAYFISHGEISILIGRLIPGLRHVISFPAGLALMNVKTFSIYTTIGGGLWMFTLLLVGYLIGDNHELVRHYMPYVTVGALSTVMILAAIYVIRHRRKVAAKKIIGG